MKPQKTIAAIMIVVSSVITGWTCVDIAYPAILGMLGLLGLQRRFTWEIKPERRVIPSLLMLLLAILFSLHYRYGGTPGWNSQEDVMSLAWQTVTRFFLAAMILMLFLGSPRRLPPSLGLFHIANAICAGQIFLLNDWFIPFRLLELLSVILAVLYAATIDGTVTVRPASQTRRSSHWLVCGLVLVAAANAGWIVSSVLYRHVEVLDYVPVWFARQVVSIQKKDVIPSQVAFSTSGELSSIHDLIQDQDTTVALQIKADRTPGYLRGCAFDTYDGSRWHNSSAKYLLFGKESMKPIPNNAHVFLFPEMPTSNKRSITIRHEVHFEDDTIFTALGISAIKVLPPVLERDGHDIFYLNERRRRRQYRFDCSTLPDRQAPPAGLLDRMLEIPSCWADPTEARLNRLADQIFAGAKTTSEKVKAVVDHFRAHYTYSLRFEVPADRDPLVHFLFDTSTGYCEYFASATAILLRFGGVPTRYVTGYLVTHKDPVGDLWQARNMDAHAWVEVWDQQRGQWMTVEPTVSEAAGGSGTIEQLERLGGNVSVAFSRFMQAVYDYGLLGVAGWLLSTFGMVATSVVLATLIALIIWWKLFHARRRKAGDSLWSRRVPDASVIALHRMLARMDRKLRSAGLRRSLTETLHTFAGRLRTCEGGDGTWSGVADWYCDYAELRYCPQIGTEHIDQLHKRAEGLRRTLSRATPAMPET